jgi:hypothetical protein
MPLLHGNSPSLLELFCPNSLRTLRNAWYRIWGADQTQMGRCARERALRSAPEVKSGSSTEVFSTLALSRMRIRQKMLRHW